MLGFMTRLVFLKQTFLLRDNFLMRAQLCEQAKLLPPGIHYFSRGLLCSAVQFERSLSRQEQPMR